jgi:glycine cleavage system aminomethyltransferase T
MAHRSSLYELHRSLGATFQEVRGWDLPGRYQDPIQEHRAIRESVGFLDLSFRALYHVTGSERTRFLNGLLTNDINKLEEGQGCYTCLLTPQGKILADPEVYALRDYHLLELDAHCKEQALDHLNKYIIADDVAFEELEDHTLLALQGPAATTLLQRLLPGTALPPGEQRCVELTLDDHPCRVIQGSITGEEGYKIVTPRERAANVWQALQAAGATPVGMAALNALRLEAEFVIRIAHRGHVNRRTSGLTMQHEPIPRSGDRVLRGEKEVGRITSAALSPTLGKIIGLGMLRRESQEPGTVVQIERNGESVPAEVTPLPFYRRATG